MLGLNPYVLWGTAAAFALTLGFAGCEHQNATTARAERDEKIVALDQAVQANTSNAETISSLKNANAELAKLVTPSAEMKRLAEQAAQTLIDVAKREEALREREGLDYAKPECAILLDTDLGAVCPNIDASLRGHASYYEDRHRGSASPGGGEVRP